MVFILLRNYIFNIDMAFAPVEYVGGSESVRRCLILPKKPIYHEFVDKFFFTLTVFEIKLKCQFHKNNDLIHELNNRWRLL